MTGLLALAVVLHWWSARGAVGPPALAVVVFAATFLEASLGHERTLWAHVPLALLIVGGVAAVLVWAVRR